MSTTDLHHTREQIRLGQTRAVLEMQRSLHVAQSAACAHTFRSLNEEALMQAGQVSADLPLAGLAVSVKDLFDVAGEVSATGSLVMQGHAPALQDAPAVARLKAAGGVVLGRTHQVEFAFSGVGVNPHFGTPVNPQALAVDASTARIPGGSSSGAAVSVASGACFVGLGSDTGGSIRIPAALCGLVGFKPTARTVPIEGAVSLSHTLDSVGALTRSVRDASLVHEILSGQSVKNNNKPLNQCHFAVPQSVMFDGIEDAVSANFERSLSKLSQAGAKISRITCEPLLEIPALQAHGYFPGPEVMAWMIPAGLWPQRQAEFDPRVAQRIALAEKMSAVNYVRLQRARADWIARMRALCSGYDALLSPTVPILAAPIASVAPGAERDAEFFRVNALLLRNTSVVNFLDGCAISLPNHSPNHGSNELATGLMIWQSEMQDDTVLSLAAQVEAALEAAWRSL